MTNNQVPSPCMSICALDEDNICVGCYRSVVEIREWALMDDDERRTVLEKSNERSKKKNPFS